MNRILTYRDVRYKYDFKYGFERTKEKEVFYNVMRK